MARKQRIDAPVRHLSNVPKPGGPPATPITLLATLLTSPSRVALNWADVSTNEIKFELQRCSGATCTGFVTIQNLSRNTQSTVDSTVVTGITYRYRIRAVNSVGPSLWSNVATVSILNPSPTPLPNAPTGITATAGVSQITLAGTAAANVDTYTVKRGLTSGSETSYVTGLTTPNYVDTSVVVGTRYFYVFVSIASGVSSLTSNEVSAVPAAPPDPPPAPLPAAPTNITATAGNAQVTLAGTPASSVDTYTLKRGLTSGSETSYVTGLLTPDYLDTTVVNDTEYFYVFVSIASGVSSLNSVEVSAVPTAGAPPPAPPDPPTLTATAGVTQVGLSWTVVADATYTLKRGTTPGGEVTIQPLLTGTSYLDSNVVAGTTYYYVMTATSTISSLTSGVSNEVTATPTAAPPPPPPQPPNPPTLTASAGVGQVSLNWSFVSGATYTLKRRTASSSYATIATLTTTSYLNTGLTGGTTYYYIVTATANGLTSAASNEVSAVPTAPVTPPDPTLTRYVSNNGSNFGIGTITDPWQTASFAGATAVAGMTVYYRGGTYTGAANTFDSITSTVHGGSSSAPLTHANYPGETVIFQPPDATAAIRLTTSTQSWLVFKGFILDGANQVTDVTGQLVYLANGTTHNIFQGLEVKNGNNFGFQVAGTFHTFLQCSVHDNGDPAGAGTNGHGFYIGTSDHVVDSCAVYDNEGEGIQVNASGSGTNATSRAIIRNNTIYNNGARSSTTAFNLTLANGTDILAYNNVVYSDGRSNLYGINVYTDTMNAGIYNNTVYGHATEGIRMEYFASAPVIINNIAYLNAVNIAVHTGTGTPVQSNNLTTDPSFVNAATGDFRLQATSAALDVGATLSQVPYDIVGVPRPQGILPDCGCYERIVAGSPPPVGGTTIVVAAGGDFQAALNNANLGDTITLASGQTFTGNFILPNKGTGTSYITITTDTPANIPATGDMRLTSYRTTFAAARAAMPKIISASIEAALKSVYGAHHFRFRGVEIGTTYASLAGANSNLILFGTSYINFDDVEATTTTDLPHHLEFDRCYIHGTTTGNVVRGIAANCTDLSVTNSWLDELHSNGQDSQAVAGWNGPARITITNNYMAAAGENVLFGGADPKIPNAVPSDIVVTNNYVTKLLRWKISDPSYAGIPWVVKNLLELKNAQRVTIDGNIFEYCWTMGQTGWGILFTPRNQGGTAPWSVVQDVTFTNNIVRHVGGGIQVLGYDDGDGHPWTSLPLDRITVNNNLFYDINNALGENGWWMVFNLGSKHFTLTHNTVGDHSGGALIVFDGFSGGVGIPNTNFVFNNNFTPHGDYGFFASGGRIGDLVMPDFLPSPTFLKNVLAGGVAYTANYSSTTLFPTVSAFNASFVNSAAGNYRLVPGSPYKNAATDGTDIGVNMELLPTP